VSKDRASGQKRQAVTVNPWIISKIQVLKTFEAAQVLEARIANRRFANDEGPHISALCDFSQVPIGRRDVPGCLIANESHSGRIAKFVQRVTWVWKQFSDSLRAALRV
jgi:hypothetical protein